MRGIKHRPILFCCLVLIIHGCKKKKETTTEQIAPSIELISITPQNVKEFKDSISILLKYKDVNGDLGETNPDETSLEVRDSRLTSADKYHIQPLAPNTGKDISIEGELRIKLNSMFLLGAGTSEQSVLTIKLKDRAGNWSNEVTSQPIIISK